MAVYETILTTTMCCTECLRTAHLSLHSRTSFVPLCEVMTIRTSLPCYSPLHFKSGGITENKEELVFVQYFDVKLPVDEIYRDQHSPSLR